MSNLDLDAPRCESCGDALDVTRHEHNDDTYNGPGLQVWPDGGWAYACECDWEHNDGEGEIPTWRNTQPKLCAELDRLTRERDEALAVLADLGGDHEALKPYAPPGWWFCSAPFKHCWIGPNGQQVFAAIGGEKRGALAAMRAADEAPSEAGQ